MSKKKIQFWYFTFLLIIFSLIYIFCIYVYTDNIKNSDRLIFNNHNQCNPINETYVQFTVRINDTVYPMHVSPHLNKSINFECLNRAEKHKIILFWNKLLLGLERIRRWKRRNFSQT